MAVILVLLAILFVALNRAIGGGQAANTEALLNSMKTALVRFKEDIGYYPPVLDQSRDLYPPYDVSDPTGNSQFNVNTWYSITTPADYLVGPDNHWADGFGKVAGESYPRNWESEIPPVGIRHPGDDGVWGATRFGIGRLDDRMWGGPISSRQRGSVTSPFSIDQGKVYGPYLELTDERLLGWVPQDPPSPTEGVPVLYPGDAGYGEGPGSHTIVDYWGSPIRYYRLPYPAGSIRQAYRPGMTSNGAIIAHLPSLAHVTVLRPYRVPVGGDADVHTLFADTTGDTTTSLQLRAAEFALFSAGPDKQSTDTQRVDPDTGNNEDNIVVTGP